MNNTNVIQVRVSPKLKLAAEKRATALGLSSVQEAIRVFLTSFSTGKATPTISVNDSTSEYVTLSPKAKARYAKVIKDLEAEMNVDEFDDPDEALKWLNQ